MGDFAYLPGLTSFYQLPGERDAILHRADALSDFIVQTRKCLGIDSKIIIAESMSLVPL